jgi:hypothetical protein
MPEKYITMRWPELDRAIRLGQIEHNREVFDWFHGNLPTSCIQTHTVVAGYCLSCMSLPVRHPFLFKFSELKQENLVDLKKGRMILNMTIGNVINFGLKWDDMTEPMCYPSFAEVVEEDRGIMRDVGNKVWNNILFEKRIIHVEFAA